MMTQTVHTDWIAAERDARRCGRCGWFREHHATADDGSIACPSRNPYARADGWAIAAGASGFVAVAALVVMLLVSGAVAECGSVLGQLGQGISSGAVQQCGLYDAAHTLSVMFLALGIVGVPVCIALSVAARNALRH